jgi:hypothetical protein
MPLHGAIIEDPATPKDSLAVMPLGPSGWNGAQPGSREAPHQGNRQPRPTRVERGLGADPLDRGRPSSFLVAMAQAALAGTEPATEKSCESLLARWSVHPRVRRPSTRLCSISMFRMCCGGCCGACRSPWGSRSSSWFCGLFGQLTGSCEQRPRPRPRSSTTTQDGEQQRPGSP